MCPVKSMTMKVARARNIGIAHLLISSANALIDRSDCSEGVCQRTDSDGDYLICASERWQKMHSEDYDCSSGVLVSAIATQAYSSSTSPTRTSYTSITRQEVPEACDQYVSPSPLLGVHDNMSSTLSSSTQTATTASELESDPRKPSEDAYGIRSYSPNGKMASVYDADSTSTFRCDTISYPPDGCYVAFWTPYDNSLAAESKSQPAPVNCGRNINFTNPLTGVSAVAVVLDRCASCVGVGNQLNDPTTDQSLVNGATVDFSRGLWNKIYDNAAGNVYDILYDGKPLQGVP